MTDIDQLRMQFTSSLRQTSQLWQHTAQAALADEGISPSCALALLFIGRLGEGTSQVTLADTLGIEGPSLVRTLDQLGQLGLIRREKSGHDRRVNTLWYTGPGRELVIRIERDLVALRARVFGGVSEADLHAALRVFQALEAHAQSGVPAPVARAS